jgi:hypothetical protein
LIAYILFPRCLGEAILSSSRRVRASKQDRKSPAAENSLQDVDNHSDDDIVSISDDEDFDKNHEAASIAYAHVPDYNDWAIVNKPKSKFHGYPCQMKGIMGYDSRRANVYIYSNGEYHMYMNVTVNHMQCRLMTEQEIQLLRSKLGEFLVASCYDILTHIAPLISR